MTNPTLRQTAWHEAGHAVVAWDQKLTVILRRIGRSMLAYLPGDAFWAIQAQLKAGTLKHLEARYQKPTRGSGELMSLYFKALR